MCGFAAIAEVALAEIPSLVAPSLILMAQIIASLTPPPPYTVTGLQVLLSLVQNWVNGMIQAVQVHFTVPAQQPPPITIA